MAFDLKLSDMAVVHDRASRVGLIFRRGRKWVDYVAFTPSGPQKFSEPATRVDERFVAKVGVPLDRAALAFLRALKSAYLPTEGLATLLMEIHTMAKTNGSLDINGLTSAELLTYHNELASSLGKPTLTSFKGAKAKLIEKIDALRIVADTPTPSQKKAAAVAAVKAEGRREGLERLAESKKEKAARKVPTKVPAAKVPKAAKAPAAAKAAGDKKPRGQGIGKFCMDLIVKGKTNEDVLKAVKTQFPDASTSASSVAWYRNKLKSEGAIA